MSDRLQTALFRRNPVGAAALTMVGLGLGVWAVVNSPVFGIDRIRVEGARQLTADEVRELAAVEPGTNLLRLSVDEVAAAVERSPWVRNAVADRALPTTLVLRVEERRGVGWVEDPSGPVVVADDGTVVDRPGSIPSALPGLGTVEEPLAPGERLGGGATLRVAASMRDGLLATLASVTEIDGELLLGLREGGEVRYGKADHLAEKNRALAEMLTWAAERGVGVEYVDVRIPSAPALRPVAG
ncbi:MAG TPA: FtsQ-type POTRA domain-containing protein [Actinomycetota bacterium]|nr:FtsQ-type POTRA domain-containing protein [Actinomycetota bacterium]